MATRVVHRKPHKFRHKKVVKRKHKTIKKKTIRVQPETVVQQLEDQKEGIVSTQASVVVTGFPKPEPTPQENAVVTPVTSQPQQAQIKSEAQPVETQPIIASSTPLEKPTQTTSVSEAKPVQSIASSLSDTEPAHKKSKLWIILALVVILGFVGGGLYYFREEFILKKADEEKKSAEPTLTPSEVSPIPELEEAATVSADVAVDTSEYSIMVLNGSGIAGEAAKARDLLEEANFVVEDIGNADAATYEKTVIKAKESVSKEFLDILREELGQIYLLDENKTLEESENVDVVVIVGREEV